MHKWLWTQVRNMAYTMARIGPRMPLESCISRGHRALAPLRLLQ
eukprot:CAMPEP_0181180432 /NCGR_PEP_ID=MMETSP1096-20121128/6797_1 /TAXON_ID=156174 ORGANISM="Chrysochromulina ericina, Strain CCMP281" /NCGR_SAMPLE_ID=MMETSP1096 /ASSEMBLY_ACC=CAM_ASM_000453 /LENGTH=43 /DNA_ID= /DNA_START= /DNA_END= /DNA_ORIENTATION=